ncbi:MAG: DUF2853 family protein [Qingshengfaniella sp.]
MSKRDALIETYVTELKEKCGVTADLDLLTKVTVGLGPSIYNADSGFIAGSDKSELETVKNNFLIKKLGLAEGPALMEAIDKALETYGRSNPRKHRAVVYYLLVKQFGKESVYA